MPANAKTANTENGLRGTSGVDSSAGIAMGAIMLTMDGEVPVEYLTPGDRIITRDSGIAVLKAVHAREITTHPYKISADRLGDNRPGADTYVTAGQRILVRGFLAQALFHSSSAMVPVSRLADGEYIAKCEEQTLRMYELEFDTAHVVYANGLEVASSVREPAVTV